MWAVWLVLKVLLFVGGITALIEGVTTVIGCPCRWCVRRRERVRAFFGRSA